MSIAQVVLQVATSSAESAVVWQYAGFMAEDVQNEGNEYHPLILYMKNIYELFCYLFFITRRPSVWKLKMTWERCHKHIDKRCVFRRLPYAIEQSLLLYRHLKKKTDKHNVRWQIAIAWLEQWLNKYNKNHWIINCSIVSYNYFL